MKNAESVRSIRSTKSIRSMKSLRNLTSDVLEEQQPTFEECLPLACRKYSCTFTVFVKKTLKQDDFYKMLKTPEEPVRYKKIKITTPYPPRPVSQNEESKLVIKSPDATTCTSPSDTSIDEDTIYITSFYDSVNNLTEIHLSKLRTVPRPLMQIISYLAPSYEFLTKITIHACIIDFYTIYELSKIIAVSSVIDICLDGSPVLQGNYFILLDHARVKYLSLCRCKINDEVCKQIATRLHHMGPAEKTLLLLNLSSNHITDEGAKCLGQALRTNRHLRYLNLADNHISDDGASFILDSLTEFCLTYNETMSKRKRRLEYLKAKRLCIMTYFHEFNAKSSDELSQYNRKSGVKKRKSSATSLRNKGYIKKDIKKDKASGDDNMIKAELLANDLLGPFVDPFAPLDTIQKDGCCYSLGNMVLSYLNLAYNRLSYFSVQKLHAVLQYQKLAKRINQSGLVKPVIEGNNIPITCVEYQKISDLTRLAKSMQPFSGRLSNAGRQRGRQTRISLIPNVAGN